MHIYLPEVRQKKGEPVEYHYEGDIPRTFGEEAEGGRIKLRLKVRSSGREIMVEGTMETSFEAVCSRCLQPFTQHLKADINESFAVVSQQDKNISPEELAEETANNLTVKGDYIYLDEYLRQIYILSQEYKPLCREDCRGICLHCGSNLNLNLCNCAGEQPVDFRLSKLKEIQFQEPSKEEEK
ncbi:MAG TPA: DUF177 domain-containing protein [Bacillota bacterium]|jgi:uncharacterized protein|nr:DUF177 domain-containing protein [Bacillota bacterium]HOB86209.1 DUF177 domain-containing protein [Bacillota bacterium]HOP68769.1 DUF177 domain-containing protein [Bacillota bacterium]HPT33864.1 DUF177 domain-containing protein [Bacillota bacterium]HPZ64583.1 DUF177 domain-containing protein [Bacillota bacterium]